MIDISTIIAYFIFINIVAFLAIKIDKERSRKGMWRAPEKTLHLLSIFGGFVGSSMAMKIYRHKTKKFSYKAIHFLILLFWISSIVYGLISSQKYI